MKALLKLSLLSRIDSLRPILVYVKWLKIIFSNALNFIESRTITRPYFQHYSKKTALKRTHFSLSESYSCQADAAIHPRPALLIFIKVPICPVSPTEAALGLYSASRFCCLYPLLGQALLPLRNPSAAPHSLFLPEPPPQARAGSQAHTGPALMCQGELG